MQKCLKRVLDCSSSRTLRQIQEDMVLLPCTYDVALVHGHLTVVLSGKLAQSTTVKEWKYVQYIMRELLMYERLHH